MLLGTPAFPASLVNTVTCQAVSTRVTASGSCYVSEDFYDPNRLSVGGFQYGGAGSTLSYQVSGSTLTINQAANAYSSFLGYATVDSQLFLAVQAAGTARMGTVRGALFKTALGGATSGFTFPGFPNYEFGFGPGAGAIPIGFGSVFTFYSFLDLRASDRIHDASISGTLQFFEADGVTPVSITEVPVPEPTSFVLLGGGLLSLGVLGYRRRYRRH